MGHRVGRRGARGRLQGPAVQARGTEGAGALRWEEAGWWEEEPRPPVQGGVVPSRVSSSSGLLLGLSMCLHRSLLT